MVIRLIYVMTVLTAGLAAAGLVSSPADKLSRLTVADRPGGLAGHERTVWRWAGWRYWLSRLLAPRAQAPPLRQRLLVGVACGAVAMLGGSSLLPGHQRLLIVAAAVATVAMVIIMGRAERPAARRRRERLVQELPQVLELLASAMNAGLPLRAAVREVLAVIDGPLAEDLTDVVRAIDLGQPEPDAWRTLRQHPQLGQISVDLARSVESGTMLVAVLRRYASLARRDRRGALEARARTVGVKSVPPLMVCFVPAFLLVCVVPTIVSALQHAIG